MQKGTFTKGQPSGAKVCSHCGKNGYTIDSVFQETWTPPQILKMDKDELLIKCPQANVRLRHNQMMR